MSLTGKTIVVTGAARGIGQAIAVACAREGAVVGINYHMSREAAFSLQASNPEQFRLMHFDVTDEPSVAACIKEFVEREGHIDGWVNNAGIILSNLLIRSPFTDIYAQINTNLLGPILCCQGVLPYMIRQRKGVIINISSVAAERPMSGQSIYSATKGGVEAFTRALAVEYARRNIRVVGIRPGPIDTEMLRPILLKIGDEIKARMLMHHLGNPNDVAEMAVYLLSERAKFATGAIFTVDGGNSLG